MRWLSETEMRSWRALIQTTTGLLAILDHELQAEHGLTLGEYEVLAILSDAGDGGLRMRTWPGRCTSRRAASPAASTAWCGGDSSSAGSAPRTGAGRTRCSPTTGWNRLREAAPTHVRGVRDALRRSVERTPARERRRARCRPCRSIAEAAAGGCDEALSATDVQRCKQVGAARPTVEHESRELFVVVVPVGDVVDVVPRGLEHLVRLEAEVVARRSSRGRRPRRTECGP